MSTRTIIVFIAMTGNPSKEKIMKVMEGHKRVGVNDVIIYARTGLETEYMSDSWREIMQACIDFAKENDMRVWLYDEINWPAGSCNNKVFYINDSYYGKKFRIENGKIKVIQSGIVWDHSTYPFADCKNDLSPILDDRSNHFLRYLDPETGEVIQTLYGDEISEDEFSRDADYFNSDAVKCFIECTHEKYYEWFGDCFGNVIPGIFTDEPHFHYGPSKEGYMQYQYYEGICQDYRETFGTDMLEDMLLHEQQLPDHDFLKNYILLAGKRFKESFLKQIYDWCEEHGIAFTGHFFQDDSSTDSVSKVNNIFDDFEYFQIPGVDEIYTKLTYDDKFIDLPASCGATMDFLYAQLQNMRNHGKKHTMAEMFALGPYNMSFAQRARAVWYAAAFGLTHYFCAMTHFDAKGNYKRDQYFMNCSYAVPDFDGMTDVTKAAELAIPYADKTPTYKVSIRYPYSAILDSLGKNDSVNYDFVLKDCIEIFGKNQIQWKLIRDEEVSETDVTVSFGPNGILEESTGNYYQTVAELFEAVTDRLSREITVTEKSGELAKNVFVRTYTDGSFIVINRSDVNGSERDLILHKDGGNTIFHIYDYGVYHGEKQERPSVGEEILPENVMIDLNGNKHFTRCEFFDGHSFEFEIEDDFEMVMHICTYPEKRDVYLDGKKIEYHLPETDLTDCFNPLYMKSESIFLEKTPNSKKQSHIITISEKDRPYLPMILLEGDMKLVAERGAENGKTHYKLVKCSERVEPATQTPFYDNASLHFDVVVPAGDGAVVTIEDYHGLVEFKINGTIVGKSGMAPYCFEISKKYSGEKVHCELVYYSSYKALFGDLEAAENAGSFSRLDWVRVSPVSSKDETISCHGLQIFMKK